MLHIQDFASLVSVLCGLNITLYFWDGKAERLSAYGEERRTEAEKWIRKAIEDALGVGAIGEPYAKELIWRACVQLDSSKWVLQADIGKAAKFLQAFSFYMAAIGIIVLAVAGLCGPDRCKLPPELWLQIFIVFAYIAIALAPYRLAALNFELRSRWGRHQLKKDVQRALETLKK